MKDHKKQVTIYDIAAKLGISASTVSRGLKDHPLIKEDTKERIRKAAREMGYQENPFASSLRRNRSNTIGVVVPRLDSYFMSKVISGIELVANQGGYNLIINQSEESGDKEKKCIETMFNSRVDGLLLSVASGTTSMEHLDLLYRKNLPVVFFDRVETHKDSISILIDNRQAAKDAVTHLIHQGCRKIVHVAGNLNRNVYADRFQGYRDALQEHTISFKDEWLFEGNLNEEHGKTAVDKMLSMDPRPDAVFASNDTTAVAIICNLKSRGIDVPGSIAVAGFNNDPISRIVDPNLTTIRYPGRKMGEVAAKTLIDQLTGNEKRQEQPTILLEHSLVIRKSSSIRK